MNALASEGDPGGSESPWATEGLALVRAGAGGLLFGVPLLYTMEVWWIGSHTEPQQMLLILAMLLVSLVILNTAAGFREVRDAKLARYRQALEAGTDPSIVSGWIEEVKLERKAAELCLRRKRGDGRMTGEEIRSLVEQLKGIVAILQPRTPRTVEPSTRSSTSRSATTPTAASM